MLFPLMVPLYLPLVLFANLIAAKGAVSSRVEVVWTGPATEVEVEAAKAWKLCDQLS